MASTVWKGHIDVRAVSFPAQIVLRSRSESISFNQLTSYDGSRIKQGSVLPGGGQADSPLRNCKGFRIRKDRYVVIEDERSRRSLRLQHV